jgi:hypothetical protein
MFSFRKTKLGCQNGWQFLSISINKRTSSKRTIPSIIPSRFIKPTYHDSSKEREQRARGPCSSSDLNPTIASIKMQKTRNLKEIYEHTKPLDLDALYAFVSYHP